ncbi:ABC transporter permease [Rhodoferax koreense]|uniref:ABC transporter permease n=1 Tax=Rhodoferax koreensis TaxID=1842727 RepID=A0A1P8K0A7_9BURK|nr:iron ABC transporter permease [Rhodoferax koreense]APW39425.1 ABC transporter permease [Rhodoferax koreense]
MAAAVGGPVTDTPGSRRLSFPSVMWLGAGLVLASLLVASARGAYAIDFADILKTLWALASGGIEGTPEQLVFLNIRLPRLLLGLAAGAGLGMAGALMQGLFRNPLADPGLIGVSSGAALAAGIAIVLGTLYFPEMPRSLGSWTLVAMAFGGSLAVTVLIYLLAQSEGGTRVGLMLLAGVAINALAGAGLGYLTFLASDEQLRSIQFWLLGSLGGARWASVLLVFSIVLIAGCAASTCARPLNVIALGEAQAVLMGVDVERTKRRAIAITALAVGAITATTGMIGFVGLLSPHCIRLVAGPDHRIVIPGSAMLGAALVLLADSVARTAVQPAELPLGVLTAFVGVPFFLLLLRQFRGRV